jgi:hypothetical protein
VTLQATNTARQAPNGTTTGALKALDASLAAMGSQLAAMGSQLAAMGSQAAAMQAQGPFIHSFMLHLWQKLIQATPTHSRRRQLPKLTN